MADCSCSPDSSTQQKRNRRRNDKLIWEESIENESMYEKGQPDDIQNDAINSTQDIEKRCSVKSTENSKLRLRFKNKLKRMKLVAYDPIIELNEIENDFKNWSSQHLVVGFKSLSELVEDKKQFGKEIFHVINKKEFKKLLPKRLKRYNVRDIRRWCLSEIENTSKENLLRMLKEEDYSPFPAASSEPRLMESTSIQNTGDSAQPGKLSDKDGTTAAVNENALAMEVNDNDVIAAANDVTNTIDQEEIVHNTVEIKSDPELFQEIIKSPDQNDIDELLNEEVPCRVSDDGVVKKTKKTIDNDNTQKLAVLEMELRARALKSFIKAQEMKNKSTGL